MKKICFLVCLLAAILSFSLCAFAEERDTEASKVGDIIDAVEAAKNGDTVNVTLTQDLEFSESVNLSKQITVNIDFNGYQISYTGNEGKNTTTAAFYLNNAGALLNLIGNNPLANPKEYTHYSDDVKADMIGEGNLIGVSGGSVNIQDAYLYATNDNFIIFVGLTDGADVSVFVDASVLRTRQGSDTGAICYLGGASGNNDVVKKTLTIQNSVEYGGFKGLDCAFNVTKGSSITNVKFYDFAITNDSWLKIGSLYMNSFEDALPIYHCEFKSYDEQLGNISVKTATGKHNIKLYDCEFLDVVNGGKFQGDSGGTAHIYIIEVMPSCNEVGRAYSYSNPKGAQDTYNMSKYKKDSFELSKTEHTVGKEKATYEAGYMNEGKGVVFCAVCNNVIGYSDKEYAPLFEALGYSAAEYGDGGMTIGFKVNGEAIQLYEQITGEDVNYGVFAVKADKIGSDDIFNENGEVRKGVIAADITNSGFNIFNLRIVGFTSDQKGIKLAMGAFVGTKTDNTTEYEYLQMAAPLDGEKYFFASYNDVLQMISANKDEETVS